MGGGSWKYAVGALFVGRKCVKFALVRVSMLLVEKGKKIAIIVVIVVSEIEKQEEKHRNAEIGENKITRHGVPFERGEFHCSRIVRNFLGER